MTARLLGLTAALLLAAVPATAAQAAYAPQLQVSVDPAGPGVKPRLTTVVTQQGSETANRQVVVSLPTGFAAPLTVAQIPVCSQAQQDARACPAESRIGSAEAVAALFGTL